MALVESIPSENEQLSLLPRSRFSVKQYHRMIETGILTENDRVELLEGWIVPMSPHRPPHATSVDYVQALIRPILPRARYVREQKPITTSDSEPEPDIAIVRAPASRYAQRHPGPKDIAAVIEVAESTLYYDRNFKLRLYARARIPVYWIVNLVHSKVEVHAGPLGPRRMPRYRLQQEYRADDSVPLVLVGKEIGRVPVREMLPWKVMCKR